MERKRVRCLNGKDAIVKCQDVTPLLNVAFECHHRGRIENTSPARFSRGVFLFSSLVFRLCPLRGNV